MECGYALSSEEHLPLDLVRYARLAEEVGFPFALVSDHQEGFLSFYEREVLPAARELSPSTAQAVRG